MDAGLAAEVARRAREDGLLVPGQAVLVAASGGADSAALAGLLVDAAGHGLPLRVALGHVDHGWRGPREAAADLEVVAAWAERLGVPLLRAGPPERVRRTEDDARRFRYGALASLARAQGCSVVATGHHLRDQAETFLLRLSRGSGPAGLAGIPPRRRLGEGGGRGEGAPLEVVRPLLWVEPARLRAYATARGLTWREDPTNAAFDRDRARLRARLVALGERGAALARDLAGAADRARRAWLRRAARVEAVLAPSWRHHVEAQVVEVDLALARSLPAAETSALLRGLGAPLEADAQGPWFTRHHADLVRGVLASDRDGACVALPRGFDLWRSGQRLLLARREAPVLPSLSLPVRDGAEAEAGGFHVRIARAPAPPFVVDAVRDGAGRDGTGRGPWTACFDANRLGGALTLRGLAREDTFLPLGRTGPVRVETFLGKAGWPSRLRRGVRVAVIADGRIAWVVGHRIAAWAAVDGSSREVARVTAWAQTDRSPPTATP